MFSNWPGYSHPSHWTIDQPATTPAPPATSIRLHRSLGILEAKFDSAGRELGCSDTFLHLKLKVKARDDAALLARIALAWTSLRALHPSLACTIEDEEGGQTIIPGRPSRTFCYQQPASEEEAIARALATLLVEPGGDDVRARTEQVLHEVVLNGARTLLSDENCLARLLLVQDGRVGDEHEHSLILVISHVVREPFRRLQATTYLFRNRSPTASQSSCSSKSSSLSSRRKAFPLLLLHPPSSPSPPSFPPLLQIHPPGLYLLPSSPHGTSSLR